MPDDRSAHIAELESIATRYNPSDSTQHFDYWLKRLERDVLSKWIIGDRVVELGCATGELSALIAPMVDDYTIVEGSLANIESAREKVPDAHYVHALWDEFDADAAVSDVVAFGTLEHAPDPVTLLSRSRKWLRPGGRLHIMVPNGNSLHRLVGVERGLLPDPLFLTEGDRSQGHLRNYTIDTILADVRASGHAPIHWEGIFLKLLPNREMLGWEPDLIEAVHRVASRIPSFSAELYVCAVNGDEASISDAPGGLR